MNVSCACWRIFSEAEFLALPIPPAGEWQVNAPDPTASYRPEGYRLQYRNCPCGSTIAVERPLGSIYLDIPTGTVIAGMLKHYRMLMEGVPIEGSPSKTPMRKDRREALDEFLRQVNEANVREGNQ